MGIEQDPTHPTGVVSNAPRGNSELSRARARKANAAIGMRVKNVEWDDIAATLGYIDGNSAMVATEKALEDGLLNTESQEFLRMLAARRLEDLLGAVLPQALDTDHPDQLSHHSAARQTINQQADLMGFKAPTEFVVNNPSAARIQQWVAMVASKDTTGVEEADVFDEVEMIQGEDGVFAPAAKEPADAPSS
jgi:hypothetical protein